jgi:SpoVK/Ycf46/Vps4 family AAA+-type ATPase
MSKRRKPDDDINIENKENKEIDSNIIKKKKIKEEFLNMEINTLDDLINLANKYNSTKEYTFNLEKLHNLLPSLIKLKNIIGMDSVKNSIVGQIIFFLNEFNDEQMDMMHTIIQGPPGVGKTLLGKIIGELYYYLGVIKPKTQHIPPKYIPKRRCTKDDLDDEIEEYMNAGRNHLRFKVSEEKEKEKEKEPFKFRIVRRSDLIASYLGQSAIKTQRVIDETEGGVLFIDEAYSLGNEEGRDSFAKEVIDTLNQNLSEKKDSLLCIIAGYKDALDKCFFAQNEGLRRRFPFVYTIEKYTAEELYLIFKKMVTDMNWQIDISLKFFENNYKYFNNMGGDIEILFFMTKIEHGKRVLFKPDDKKKINNQDIENAFKIFKVNKQLKKDKMIGDAEDETWKNLYN